MSNFAVRNIDDAADVAKVFSVSGFFKDSRQLEQAMVKVIAGAELGMGPMQAMSSFHVVEGKVEMAGGAIAARIKASGKYDYRIVTKSRVRCEIAFFERIDGRREEIGREVWDADRAQAAGLWGKNVWKKYPDAMLFNRCIASGYRAYCPDVFSFSVYGDGEISGGEEDFIVVDVTEEKRDPVIEVEPRRQGGQHQSPSEPRRRPTPRNAGEFKALPKPESKLERIRRLGRAYVLEADDFQAVYAKAAGKKASDHKWANIALSELDKAKESGGLDDLSPEDKALARTAYRVLRDDYAADIEAFNNSTPLDAEECEAIVSGLGYDIDTELRERHPAELKRIRDALRKQAERAPAEVAGETYDS